MGQCSALHPERTAPGTTVWVVSEVLVISGPCGAGKSSVGFECLELLQAGGVGAAMIDAELAYFHPKPDDDPQGTRVAEQALAAVAPVYAAAGIGRLDAYISPSRCRHSCSFTSTARSSA